MTTTLTDKLIARLTLAVEKGVPYRVAAEAAGCGIANLRFWRGKGDALLASIEAGEVFQEGHALEGQPVIPTTDTEAQCLNLARALRTANACAEARLVERVFGASEGRYTEAMEYQGHDAEGTPITQTVPPKYIPGNLRAATWMLERRFPERWKGDGPVTITNTAVAAAGKGAEVNVAHVPMHLMTPDQLLATFGGDMDALAED